MSRPPSSPDPTDTADAIDTRPPLKIKQVAAILGLSPASVSKALHKGQIPGTRIGRRWVIDAATFWAWKARAGEPGRDPVEQAPAPPVSLAVVSSDRSVAELALAAVDRQIADRERRITDAEQDLALLRWQRDQIAAQTATRRVAS